MKYALKLILLIFFSFSVSLTQLMADYPEKEIKVIVNYGAGGGVDRTARSLQKFLPSQFGKSVVVENHKGAGGKIGLKKGIHKIDIFYTQYTKNSFLELTAKLPDELDFKNIPANLFMTKKYNN